MLIVFDYIQYVRVKQTPWDTQFQTDRSALTLHIYDSVELKCARARIVAWNLPVINAGCISYRYEIRRPNPQTSYRYVIVSHFLPFGLFPGEVHTPFYPLGTLTCWRHWRIRSLWDRACWQFLWRGPSSHKEQCDYDHDGNDDGYARYHQYCRARQSNPGWRRRVTK